ncbi:hypothetical protein ACFSR6_09220 [Pedobacter vanadiisoli]|uniref:YD repeat-containing protein n=1 Tax=Pedobacter vanadiisoli TaxID=1761975 RepID=A0ABW5MHH7_9SPHI
MKYRFLLFFAIALNILFMCAAFPQASSSLNNFDLKKMLPTSPEAAMLGRFGDIPIGYYTGTADISIPFYTIRESNVEIPVVLRYHGSGIKVEDEASNVGLGWSLEPGGSIIKIISGKEDPVDGDYLPIRDATGYSFLKSHSIQGVYNERNSLDLWPCNTTYSGDNFQTIAFLEQNEGQPDIFQYSFAGYSGKFYINPETHNIVLIDKSADIEFIYNAPTGWVAKTMDGNKFYFNSMERATPNYMLYDNSSLTFKLTKVEVNNGKEINLSYVDGFYTNWSYSESYHSEYPLSNVPGFVEHTSSTPMHYTKTLKTISTGEVIVEFNLEDRDDLDGGNTQGIAGHKRIASVDIKDAQTLQKKKSFTLTYDYFNSGFVGGSYKGNNSGNLVYAPTDTKRLKLLSVREYGYNESGQAIPAQPYIFSYDESVQLPLKTSFARDFWGYYNGQNNTKLIPDLSFFYYSGDTDYGSSPQGTIEAILTPNGAQYLNSNPQDVSAGIISGLQGAVRAPDSTKMKAGLLKRITYPTGGFTTFEYQANDFNNHVYPDVERAITATQQKYVSDYNRTSDVNSFTFSLPNSQNVTFNNIITRGPNTALSFFDLQPSTITLSKTVGGVTTVIKTWQMFYPGEYDTFNNDGTFQWTEAINLPYIAGAQYTVSTYLPDALGPQESFPNLASVSSNFSYQNSGISNYTSSYGGGVRVSLIKNYRGEGELASSKKISYLREDNITSGKIMSEVKPLYKRRMNAVHQLSDVSNGTLSVQLKNTDVWFISSESAVPLSTAASGNPVGYSRVVETEVAPGGAINGKHIYNYINVESDSRPTVPDNPYGLNGKLEKEEIYANNSPLPITEVSYSYINKQTSSFSNFKVMPANVGDNPCSIPMNFDPELVYKYSIVAYPILSNWYVLSGKQTKQNFASGPVISHEDYTYNSKGQQVKVETINSELNKKTITSIYPVDNPSDPMSAQLISKGLFDHIQEQKTLLNDNTELSKSNVNYRLENGQAVRSDVVTSFGAAAGVTDITFDKYGNYKTVLQFTQKGAPTSLLWSFGYSKPIAEIKNVTFPILEAVLGATAIQDFANLLSPTPAQINSFLAPLRANPINPAIKDILVTSFTYKPLAGIASQTDANGKTTYYEYDSFQRLSVVKDQNNNIIKTYCYNYAGQLTDCNSSAGGTTPSGPVQVYARVEVLNPSWSAPIDGSTAEADIYVALYSDAACTQPVSLPQGINVDVSTTGTYFYNNYSSTSSSTNTYSIPANTNRMLLGRYVTDSWYSYYDPYYGTIINSENYTYQVEDNGANVYFPSPTY